MKALVLGMCLAAMAASQTLSNGYKEYRDGDYERAIPPLQQSAANDATLHAALCSSLVWVGKPDEAGDEADYLAQHFPDSVPAMVARGEYSYYMGDMPNAEKLFMTAFKRDPNSGRALLGLARIRNLMRMHRTARLLILQAHQLDSDDALITYFWTGYLVGQVREQYRPAFIAAHPWFYKHLPEQQKTEADTKDIVSDERLFQAAEPPKETMVKFFAMRPTGRETRGLGLELVINGGKPLRLVFDTGATGIYLTQKAIDKAGLEHLGSGHSFGVGGAMNEDFFAVADTCAIGPVQFKNCWLTAKAGKRKIVEDVDGLIGGDVFSDYLLDINFPKQTLHLTPLEPRKPNPQGYDRIVPDDEKDFTPVFVMHDHLGVTTTVNDKIRGIFFLDTGAQFTSIDATFARLGGKLSRNDYVHVHGVSGEVKDIFQTDKATLAFARFRQDNVGLLAFEHNISSEHQDVRIAGLLGFPLLQLFDLKIDYRNGLVKFDYLFEKKK